MITLKIDVTKLDKKRFFYSEKGAIYADLVLFETPNGKYGDYLVKQAVTKEEREARLEMPILGNGKDWGKKETPKRSAPPPRRAPVNPNQEAEESDDVPF